MDGRLDIAVARAGGDEAGQVLVHGSRDDRVAGTAADPKEFVHVVLLEGRLVAQAALQDPAQGGLRLHSCDHGAYPWGEYPADHYAGEQAGAGDAAAEV